MIEIKVQSLGLDQASRTPVVILQELDGERLLPIWIGAGEAQAIAMELAGMKFSRPLTHDLAVALIRGLGGDLQRVIITRVEENTYYAEMVIHRGTEVFSIDARPSDSIAIALRMSARIFTSDELLAATSIQVEQAEDSDELGDPSTSSAPASESASDPPRMTAEQLQEYLKKLGPEDLGRFNP